MTDKTLSLKDFLETRTTLYFTHKDISAEIKGESLVYTSRISDMKETVKLRDIRRVVFLGIPGFSGEVMYKLCGAGIPIDFLDIKGALVGQVHNVVSDYPDKNYIYQERLLADPGAIDLVRDILLSKIDNNAEVLRRRCDSDFLPNWDLLRSLMIKATTTEELRGAEGIAAKLYFDQWNSLLNKFEWNGRKYHPAPDPVNTLLSIGYNLIYNRMTSALRASGLNPRIGFFHMIRGKHSALSSDLMEPFRAFADGEVLKMIRKRQVTPEQFGYEEGQCSITDKNLFINFVTSFENMFSREVVLYRRGKKNGWEYTKRTVNDHIEDLAASFALFIRSKGRLAPMRLRLCADI